ncbi:type I restriction endonuclease subunit R [Aliarcobacter butzleri]|uniref:type I restriction endonuclease subunit R n=1 Tax=Aliarcobacter butzleri TaxID=28197 RepID=UPI0021B40152|nr:type I restriction endonuclease subunit R [Aliarcobacter butzleri]MCT7594238.1 type I restriction endonuclease subunit R [Aliarcobacter butzleri]MCT7598861.1 type I restriction endonuclease subunit R [Aliarcobacter butzleri]MCT7652815.1 type I restriction endonuclease subunit R [Aliarcobacter butzleri]
MINEEQVELLAIEWFKELGYDYLLGYEIAPDSQNPHRTNYQEVILNVKLQTALIKLNQNIPLVAIEEAIDILKKSQHATLIQNNRAFHQMLLQGINVDIKDGDDTKGDVVKIIDFENPFNNDFLVVNQFTIKGTKGNRRPDLIVFVNGLPISIIELKNPADENADIYKAYNQLQTYKDEIEDLFVFNEALVISDGINARVGSLTATDERFMFWRTIKDENDKPLLEYELDTLIKGFFHKEYFLDYIQNFVLFEDDGKKIIKKIAGYHQFHAVREAVDSVIVASNGGNKKGGVVWHTQGSGKSISMACFAGKLTKQSAMKNPTLVIVTDRNDLDGQLFATFSSAKMLLGQEPIQMDDVTELRETLSNKPSGGIIFTTIQKFGLKKEESRFPVLSDRSNIVVIADEAHRSQYGFDAMLDKDGKFKYGYAQHLRDALPNATFIGFTGTPIESEDRDTRAVFGDYISVYDIEDAVRDGATVPIYYESRLAKLDLNSEILKEIDKEVGDLDIGDEVSDRERFKSKWSALEKLVGSEPRIKQIAQDIVTHFEDRTAVIDGKGIIVAMSRHIAVDLYDAIVALRPDWHNEDPTKGAVKIIMTGSASDEAKLQKHIYSKQVKKDLEKRIKNVDDELKLVIVRDMWLTGFDAPSMHTMYIDKPMKSHNLMQAIARVNRVFKDKKGGLVVDYIGIANELKHALKIYTGAGGKGTGTIDTAEALAEMLKRLDIVQNMYHDFDYSLFMTKAHMLLAPAANYILGLDDGKKRYLDEVLALTKAFSLCGTLDEAKEHKEEIAFFQAVKAVIQKASSKLSNIKDPNKAIKQLIDNAVISDGVEDIFSLVGLDKPNIGILSDEFLEDVAHMPYKNLAVELLERLLKDDIKAKTKNNVVQEKKFSDRLQATLGKYHNRAIETAKVIEELIQMAKDFAEAAKHGKDLGLNFDELAFYDALAENEAALREMGDEILKKIAIELTEKLRSSISVDWQKRESVRAKMRNIIRIILKRFKYPPDKAEEALDMVMKQAEVLSDEWSK